MHRELIVKSERRPAPSTEPLTLSVSANTELDATKAISLLRTNSYALSKYQHIINKVSANGICNLSSIVEGTKVSGATRTTHKFESFAALEALAKVGLIFLDSTNYYPSSNGIQLVFASDSRKFLGLELNILKLAYDKDGKQITPNFDRVLLQKLADLYRNKPVKRISLKQALALEPNIPEFFVKVALTKGQENRYIQFPEANQKAPFMMGLLPLLFETFHPTVIDALAGQLLSGGQHRIASEESKNRVVEIAAAILMKDMGENGIGKTVEWKNLFEPIQIEFAGTQNLGASVIAILRYRLREYEAADGFKYEIKNLSKGIHSSKNTLKAYRLERIVTPTDNASATS